MERCWLLNSFFTVLLGWSSLAVSSVPQGVSCSSFLNDRTKKLVIHESLKIADPQSLYKIKLNADNRFRQPKVSKEDLADLFRMLGQTQFFNTSEKVTLEKGSLFLGQKIDDSFNLQAEYTFDKPNQKLHLTRIYLVNSKNGQEQVLSKEPLDHTGENLIGSDLNILFEKNAALGKLIPSSSIKIEDQVTDTSTPEQNHFVLDETQIFNADVSFPTVISGYAFKKIKQWAYVIPHLDHVEINVVDSVNKQRWALAKGQFRRAAEFAKERFFKQVVGLLIIYMVVDGTSNFTQDFAKYAVDVFQSQGSSIVVKVKETKVDGEVVNSEQKFEIKPPKNLENNKK